MNEMLLQMMNNISWLGNKGRTSEGRLDWPFEKEKESA